MELPQETSANPSSTKTESRPIDSEERTYSRKAREQEEKTDREKDEEKAERSLTLIGTVGAETWTQEEFPEGKFIGIESANSKQNISIGLGLASEKTEGENSTFKRITLEYGQNPVFNEQYTKDPRLSVDVQAGKGWHIVNGYQGTLSATASIDLMHSVMVGTFTEDVGFGAVTQLPLLDIPNVGLAAGIKTPKGWSIEAKAELNMASRSFGVTERPDGISAISYSDEDGNIVTESTVSEYGFALAPQLGAGIQLTIPLQRIN